MSRPTYQELVDSVFALRECARDGWEYIVTYQVEHAAQRSDLKERSGAAYQNMYRKRNPWLEVLLNVNVSGHTRKYVSVLEAASSDFSSGRATPGDLDGPRDEVGLVMLANDAEIMQGT